MRRIGIIAILFGALIWGSTGAAVAAAPTSAEGRSAIARANSLLSGKRDRQPRVAFGRPLADGRR
jgi:hypothetical protein